MARYLDDTLEAVQDNDDYRETLYIVKAAIQRIRREYLADAISLSETAIGEIEEELETVSLTIENALF